MVVVQHVLVGLQIELVVVERVLAEADRAVLVDDASDLDHAARRQLVVVLVADDLHLLAYRADC